MNSYAWTAPIIVPILMWLVPKLTWPIAWLVRRFVPEGKTKEFLLR